MMHTGTTDLFSLGFINFEPHLRTWGKSSIFHDCHHYRCPSELFTFYLGVPWDLNVTWLLQTVSNGTHIWAYWFMIYSQPELRDVASVQVAWNITDICSRMLCICQMAFTKKRLCLPWVSRWPWPITLKVFLQGVRGVLGFRSGISYPSGNGSLSLRRCIWKRHNVIPSCSRVTKHRGGDEQKGIVWRRKFPEKSSAVQSRSAEQVTFNKKSNLSVPNNNYSILTYIQPEIVVLFSPWMSM